MKMWNLLLILFGISLLNTALAPAALPSLQLSDTTSDGVQMVVKLEIDEYHVKIAGAGARDLQSFSTSAGPLPHGVGRKMEEFCAVQFENLTAN